MAKITYSEFIGKQLIIKEHASLSGLPAMPKAARYIQGSHDVVELTEGTRVVNVGMKHIPDIYDIFDKTIEPENRVSIEFTEEN